MEVDHHKSRHPPCLHVEQTQEEEGLISLSQAEVEGKAEEADAFDVTLWKYIIISIWLFAFHFRFYVVLIILLLCGFCACFTEESMF